jgi:hypothetical protein
MDELSTFLPQYIVFAPKTNSGKLDDASKSARTSMRCHNLLPAMLWVQWHAI